MPFVAKKYKVKIGTKADAGDSKEVKRFTNGHKSFTSAEARAMVEQQTREVVTAKVFEDFKSTILRPRNPLCGEQTPRDGGEMGQSRVEGFLLLPPDRPKPVTPPDYKVWSKRNRPKEASLKVGQLEETDVRTLLELSPAAPRISPSGLREIKRIEAMRLLQDTMGSELSFLYSKLDGRQTKISSHLIRNSLDTLSERDEARLALLGKK